MTVQDRPQRELLPGNAKTCVSVTDPQLEGGTVFDHIKADVYARWLSRMALAAAIVMILPSPSAVAILSP